MWLLSVRALVVQEYELREVQLRTGELRQRLEWQQSTELPRLLSDQSASIAKALTSTRSWSAEVAKVQRTLTLQSQSENVHWQTFLRQRQERTAISRHDQQQRDEARKVCDRTMQQVSEDQAQADRRIKQWRTVQGADEVWRGAQSHSCMPALVWRCLPSSLWPVSSTMLSDCRCLRS